MSRRLSIFAKGNVDVKDSLLWSRVDGKVQWNGLGEALRTSHPGVIARVKHETAVGFASMTLPGFSAPDVPAFLRDRVPPLAAHPLDQQHRTALFDASQGAKHDAVVLSLQADAMNARLRHRPTGFTFLAEDLAAWPAAQRALVLRECESLGFSSVDDSMAALERLLDAIDEHLGAPVLIYNLCPVQPGERVHSWLGAGDATTLRLQRFDLALAELSTQRSFSIVDVQRLSATHGAGRLKVDHVHFTAQGWRLIAEEVVRILAEHGLLDGGAP